MANSGSAGLALRPPPPDSEWWDKKTFSGPVVVKLQNQYRMYYYGRDGDEWNFGVKPFSSFVPTGRIGMATSEDGVRFQRVWGGRPGGSVMDPSDDPAAFDAVHIAVGDVVEAPGSEELWMYYFGGGMEEATLVGTQQRHRGVKLQMGLAVSRDGGRSFERAGGGSPIVEVGGGGEWDSKGVAWPRVLPPSGGRKKWLMTYHTRQERCFAAGAAISSDGVRWEKQGQVLGPGGDGAWDDGGVSVRHVIEDAATGLLLMFYEGSNVATARFAIGLATSSDSGATWIKDESCGREPGGPLLEPRQEEQGAWDSRIVGTPYVVRIEDGSLRMYYLGLGGGGAHGIGVAASRGADFRSWARI